MNFRLTGYVGRQALYSCISCPSEGTVPAGFCLACSYVCHDGHDLHELYTKRNFRCDCGNSKFKGLKCKLYAEKDAYNADNKYNQNFDGLYCTCKRPYPDHEDDTEDEMIQCVVCEDWYHGRHLVNRVPVNGDYQEMVCGSCMDKHTFLWAYNLHCRETQAVTSETSFGSVDVESTDPATSCSDVTADNPSSGGDRTPDKSSSAVTDTSTAGSSDDKPTSGDGGTAVTESSTEQQSTSKDGDEPHEECLLRELQKREVVVGEGATYWTEGFRNKLCTCSSCMTMYINQGVVFLTNQADTMLEYEQRGQDKGAATAPQNPEAMVLQGMGHVQQIEMLRGFHDMRSQLSEYLKHFAENGKVVREEDIREFFEQMQARKRQRTDNMPSHFCR